MGQEERASLSGFTALIASVGGKCPNAVLLDGRRGPDGGAWRALPRRAGGSSEILV